MMSDWNYDPGETRRSGFKSQCSPTFCWPSWLSLIFLFSSFSISSAFFRVFSSLLNFASTKHLNHVNIILIVDDWGIFTLLIKHMPFEGGFSHKMCFFSLAIIHMGSQFPHFLLHHLPGLINVFFSVII